MTDKHGMSTVDHDSNCREIYDSIVMTLIGLPVEFMITILRREKITYFLDTITTKGRA
jgi:hypothetical protein